MFILFFFNDTATTEIYTLSLHDALPIYTDKDRLWLPSFVLPRDDKIAGLVRSEEHTSELQSRRDLVCRLLLEKKKLTNLTYYTAILFSSYLSMFSFVFWLDEATVSQVLR